MSTGQVIEGPIDTLSREDEAKVATRLREINRSNVSNFNKRLQTCLLFNEYSLDYDTSQVIKEILQ